MKFIFKPYAIQVMFLSILGFMTTTCSSIDCPLNNNVISSYKLSGSVSKLADTLSITTLDAQKNEVTLINRNINTDSLVIPISMQAPQDVLYFYITPKEQPTLKDTITITKEDLPQFTSIDCDPVFFHNIKSVQCTNHAIDSIVINQAKVTYDVSKANFKIYFKDSDK